MPYPKAIPEAKHDIVSPKTISISSGILKPFFQSTQEIIQQIKSKDNFKLQKLALIAFTYHDVPSIPQKPSKVLYFAGFCKLSSIYKNSTNTNSGSANGDDLEFDHETFQPYNGMTLCHIATKRADKSSSSSLSKQDLDNSNKFMLLCNNLRLNDMVVLIQCPKTNRAGFFIPMKETEDGSNFSAYWYVGEVDVVEQMLLHVEKYGSSGGDDMNGLEEKVNNEDDDEPIWKPDDDDDDTNQVNHSHTNGMDDGNDTNDMWQPPGSTNDTNNNNGDDDNNMWKPPGEDNDDDNDGDNLWQPPGFNNTDDNNNNNNDDESNLWDQPQEQTDNLWNQSTETTTNMNNGESNNVTMTSQENKFHADSGAAAADKFYSELTRSLGTRADSILYHMRNFNGWVKATQIAELDPVTMITDGSSSGGGNKGSKKRKRTRHPLRILDLACGKGGDLGKWVLHNRGVQSYVGSDVARGSLVDAAERARKIANQLKNKCTFILADLGSDVPGRPKNRLRGGKMQKLLSWSLETDSGIGDPAFHEVRGGGIKETQKFDVISIQFAIHYMMSSEKRARRFFQTVSELLEIGGNLIATTIDARVVMDHMMDVGCNFHFDDDEKDYENEYTTIKVGKEACQLKFHRDIVKKIFDSNKPSGIGTINPNLFGLEYTFTLIEGEDHAAGVGQAVDLPEWLTPLPVLKQLAEEAGLSMEYAQNFHEFFEKRKDSNSNHAAHSALYNMNVLNWKGTISEQEWDISRMYVAVKFRKDRESVMILDDEDDDDIEDDDDEDDEMDEFDEFEQPEPTPPPKKPPIEINMKDPAVMKMYTKAMAKARMTYSGDWKSLSSDERKALINEELANML